MSGNMELSFRVRRLSDKATLPRRATEFAAGYDLASAETTTIPSHGKALIETDLVVEVPLGHYGRIAPRSSLAWKHHVDVGAGVVDSDYRGPLKVVLFNHSDKNFEVNTGDRIAQIVLERISTPPVEEVSEVKETERGSKGFGSTGK